MSGLMSIADMNMEVCTSRPGDLTLMSLPVACTIILLFAFIVFKAMLPEFQS